MRTPIIAGNWKMHKTVNEAVQYIETIQSNQLPQDVEAVICAPFLTLHTLQDKLAGSSIGLGAQNAHWEKEGAYTGEVSVHMLQDLGVGYVILGHSERRTYFAETCEQVNKKTIAALNAGIIPIVCVGETIQERESGRTFEVVSSQVKKALKGIASNELHKVVLAYEPVWAIGTGRASSANDAEEVIAYIRKTLMSEFGTAVAEQIRIQYGGSVKPENIATYMAEPNIDGALVGGAALDPESFSGLVKAASRVGGQA
ncbi:triosephosphate isomerase [Croceifilum oryzae]|uniref:Triosephosphate isomerase n=1 Tax=Croceifilum oryzae TaxID=1553429 RepID=A0AAJ1TK10_9BACL|nr:triose-phosphate isomerase [Croceifilum oryzae]MDQ0415965.1 triosephosphate isomerase [Croceifilum oryzae]